MPSKNIKVIALALAALLGVVLIIWNLAGSSDPVLVKEVFLFDVKSGQVYRADISKHGLAYPALHPATNQRTLIPIAKDDSGKWHVGQRRLKMLTDLAADPKLVDFSTGLLLSDVRDIQTYSHPR